LTFTTKNYIKERDFLVELDKILFEKDGKSKRVLIAMSGALKMP
jgi:hypothetical protein